MYTIDEVSRTLSDEDGVLLTAAFESDLAQLENLRDLLNDGEGFQPQLFFAPDMLSFLHTHSGKLSLMLTGVGTQTASLGVLAEALEAALGLGGDGDGDGDGDGGGPLGPPNGPPNGGEGCTPTSRSLTFNVVPDGVNDFVMRSEYIHGGNTTGVIDSIIQTSYGFTSAFEVAKALLFYSGIDLFRQHDVGQSFTSQPPVYSNTTMADGTTVQISGRSTAESYDPINYDAVVETSELWLLTTPDLPAGQRDWVQEQFGGDVVIRSCLTLVNIGE